MHLKWLLPLLPTDCQHYVEPFCGSASILLNRPAAPCETINDLNSSVINFFQVLRAQPLKLIRQIKLTPYAEQEFKLAQIESSDSLEEARRFFVRTLMSFMSSAGSFRISTKVLQHSSPPKNFHNSTEDFIAIAERLLQVQIVQGDGIDLIERCDSKGTFFYVDPPYLHETRNGSKVYKHEMSREDHERLIHTLKKIHGRAAVSGYDNDLYDSLGWQKFHTDVRSTAGTQKLTRTEVVWMNYDPVRQDLFSGAVG